MFTVIDAALESPRAKTLEISATGPLYGKKVMPALFNSRLLEDEVLAAFELTWEGFKNRMGSRRITRVKLENLALEAAEGGFWISFDLPKGSFATVVLREIMKVNVDGLETEDEDEIDT